MDWPRWIQIFPSLDGIVFLTNNLTLNILRASKSNPELSAQIFFNGQFHFNPTPLDPPVTKVLIHSKPTNRDSWYPNGK